MKIIKTVCLSSLVVASTLFGDMSLSEAAKQSIKNNPDVQSKAYNNKAFEELIQEREGAYYPKVDFLGSLEKRKVKQSFDNGKTTRGDKQGYNAQVQLEQNIYNPKEFNQVDSANYRFSSNKYKNMDDIEIVLLNTIDSFFNVAKFQKRLQQTTKYIQTLDENYQVALNTEKINKEALDKVQTKAKIVSAKNKFISEKNNENVSKSYFFKNTKVLAKGVFTEPDLDSLTLPSLKELQEKALKNNFKILSQIEKIKEKRAIVAEEEGGFLPTLKLKLFGIYDKDLYVDDAKTRNYGGKLELKYNIFNGNINSTRTQREKLFLREAQSELNVVSDEVINDLNTAYMSFKSAKEQLAQIKELIVENERIVKIYNDQFNTGARSFIDVLNVESDLYNSRIELLNTQKDIYISYYKVLKATSSLKTQLVDNNKIVN